MIRRSPTKIELRLDDLTEYEALKKERDSKKDGDKQGTFSPSWVGKLSQAEILERIGYAAPTPNTTHARPNIRSNLTL